VVDPKLKPALTAILLASLQMNFVKHLQHFCFDDREVQEAFVLCVLVLVLMNSSYFPYLTVAVTDTGFSKVEHGLFTALLWLEK
jgi:hypothetical protein